MDRKAVKKEIKIHWKRRTLVYGLLIFSLIYIFVHFNVTELFTVKILRFYLLKNYQIDLSVAKWDVSIIEGSISGRDLYLSRKGSFFCRIPRFKCSISLLELLSGNINITRLYLRGMELNLSVENRTLNKDQIFAKSKILAHLFFKISNIEIEKGKLEIQDFTIPIDFKTNSFHLSINGSEDGKIHEISALLKGVMINHLNKKLHFSSLMTNCYLSANAISIPVIDLKGKQFSFHGISRINLVPKLSYHLSGTGKLDVSSFFGIRKLHGVNIRGKINYNFDLNGSDRNIPQARGELSSNNFKVGNFILNSIVANIDEQEGVFRLKNLHVYLGDVGSFSGQLGYNLLKGVFAGQGQIWDFPLSAFNDAGLFLYPLKGIASGNLIFNWKIGELPHFRCDGLISNLFVKLPVGEGQYYNGVYLKGSASYESGLVKFNLEKGIGDGLSVSSSGRLKGRELWIDHLHVFCPMKEAAVNELMRIARLSPELKKRLSSLRFEGDTTFDGSVHLKGTFPDVEGKVTVKGLWVNGIRWPEAGLSLNLTKKRLKIPDAWISSRSGKSRAVIVLGIKGGTRLRSLKAKFIGEDVKKVFPVLDFMDIGINSALDLSEIDGRAFGDINLTISEDKSWYGTYSIEIKDFSYENYFRGNCVARGIFDGREVKILKFLNIGKRNKINGRGYIGLGSGKLNISGFVKKVDSRMFANLTTIDIDGKFSGDYLIKGTLSKPEFAADLHSQRLFFQREPFGKVRFLFRFKSNNISFATTAEYKKHLYKAIGTISTGKSPLLDMTIFLENVKLQPFLKELKIPFAHLITGTISGEMFFTYTFGKPSKTEIMARISDVHLSYREAELRNDGAVYVNFENGKLSVNQARFVLGFEPLKLDGYLQLYPYKDINFYIGGGLRFDNFKHFFKGIELSGRMKFDWVVTGNPSDPLIAGKMQLKNVSLKLDFPQLVLENINGSIEMNNRSLKSDGIKMVSSFGEWTLSGQCILLHFLPSRWNINAISKKITIFYPDGFLTKASASLRLIGNTKKSLLSGNVWIDRCVPVKKPDIVELFMMVRKMSKKKSAFLSFGKPNNIALDVSIHGDRCIRVESNYVNLVMSTDMKLKGTLNWPVIEGNLLVNSGYIKFKMNTFSVNHGYVSFNNPFKIDPVLNFELSSDIKDYLVKVNLLGIASHPFTKFTSVPALPPGDVLRLITTGYLPPEQIRATNEYQTADTTTLLSQIASATAQKRIKKVTGFDSISVDTYGKSSSATPGARLTVGKQFSPDFFITYSRSVSSQEEDLIFMEYRVNRRLTIIASRDERGYFGIDFRFRKKLR